MLLTIRPVIADILELSLWIGNLFIAFIEPIYVQWMQRFQFNLPSYSDLTQERIY